MQIELNQKILSYLVILAAGLVLFSVTSLPLEFSALFILIALVFAGLLTPAQAFMGFGSETIILFGSLFVLVQALIKTGVVRSLEQLLLKYAGNNRSINYFLLLIVGSIQSALISNTATMAVMIPLSNSIAARFSETPRRWLMPLAFMVMVSGIFTLIGTSTNILVSGMLPSLGLSPLGLFSTTGIALCLWLFCLLYALFVMPHILGPGESITSAEIDIKYDLRSFSAEVVVLNDSPLCNLSLVNNPLFSKLDITVLGIMRPGQFLVYPSSQYVVRADDRLILEGNVKSLSEASNSYGLRFLEEHKITEKGLKDQQDIRTPTLKLYEVLVTARSLLNGRTAVEIALRSRYRISLIAINRHGITMRERLSKIKIESGDLLLVQFLDFIDNQVISDLGLIPLQRIDNERSSNRYAPLVLLLFISALFLGTFSSFSIALTCLSAAVLLVLAGILKPHEVYNAIEWKILLFVGAVLGIGQAMESSGTALYLSQLLDSSLMSISPIGIVAVFVVAAVLLTQLMSNQASAVILLPIAIRTAELSGLNPMTMVMAVTIGSSLGFMTPLEPGLALIYGPGGYHFKDYIKVGIGLTVASIAIAVIAIPIFYPL